jgi:hypothetical protein
MNTTTSPKPTTGRLIYVLANGANHVLEFNKPFAILQRLKKEYVQKGYSKELLKITY